VSRLFGDDAWRKLDGRERDVFPRLVRPAVLALLWLVLLAAFGGLAAAVVMLGELR